MYKIGNKLESYFAILPTYKSFFMGIAILMIVCCHIQGADPGTKLWRIFYPGYLGVDIFLFLSGYGLCRSIQKNDTVTFYRRRFSRIMPLYMVLGLVIGLIHTFCLHENLSAWDWFCTLTSLSFWRAGGVFVEWYLCTLAVLYLLFPLLFRSIKTIKSVYIVGAYILLLLAVIACCHMPWEYECALSRAPMFLIGIMCFKIKDQPVFSSLLPVYIAGLISAAILWHLGKVETYIVGYMCAPWMILFWAVLTKHVFVRTPKFIRGVERIGQYSLEIYAANCLALALIPVIPLSLNPCLLYLGLHLVLIPLMTGINKGIHSLLA